MASSFKSVRNASDLRGAECGRLPSDATREHDRFRWPPAAKGGDAVNQQRAADDFATIRARMEELRREREGEEGAEKAAAEPVRARTNRIGQVAIAVGRLRNSAG
jgi:hypothetical protein